MDVKRKETYNFEDFVAIIKQLRAPGGCPWDKEQTHESLKNCLIEECYEVIEAINNKDMPNLREELGDVLLQVVMHAVIAEEENTFTLQDIVQEISEKMIRRHPHVFGEVVAESAQEVLENWDEIKKEEKQEKSVSESLLKVPKALPANIRAVKVQKKAAKVGMDFASYEEALQKVYEELEELEKARKQGEYHQIEMEFGDIMYSIVNLSRFLQVNAENSLTNATDKFINRFVGIEGIAKQEGKTLEMLSPQHLDELWTQIKMSECEYHFDK